jgi:chromosome segregation ATPase
MSRNQDKDLPIDLLQMADDNENDKQNLLTQLQKLEKEKAELKKEEEELEKEKEELEEEKEELEKAKEELEKKKEELKKKKKELEKKEKKELLRDNASITMSGIDSRLEDIFASVRTIEQLMLDASSGIVSISRQLLIIQTSIERVDALKERLTAKVSQRGKVIYLRILYCCYLLHFLL